MNKNIRLNLRINEKLKNELEELAIKKGLNVSEIIRLAIENEINKNKKDS